LESHDLESLSPLAHHRLVHPANGAINGVPFRAFIVSFLTIASSRQNSRNQNQANDKTPTSTIIKCCQLTCFSMYACVKTSGVPVSHTDTSPHAVWGCRQTHTYTCKRTQVRPSLPNPPILQYSASVLLQFVCRIVGGWSFVCCLVERSEGETQMERRSEEKEEMEVQDGPSAAQGHCVDDLLQLAPQSLSPRLLVLLQSRQDLRTEGGGGQSMSQ